jgi:predicted nucleotide-binding protein
MSAAMPEVKFHELHHENLLALYDIALDIDQERQFSPGAVSIPLMRLVIRFNELFPGDSIATRDRYCESRWKALKYLERIGAISNVTPIEGTHRWYGRIELKPTARFLEVFNAVETEYFRRTGTKEEHGMSPSPASKASTTSDRSNVFVVHGRDSRLRDGMFTFLRSIRLDPIEWAEAVMMTGKSSPYIGEILETTFSKAQAIVVLLSGDDEARLRDEFRGANEAAYETNLTPQARPNVLFEAGMAMAYGPDRTVLVEFGNLCPFSDVAGRHSVKMDGSSKKRQELAQRLERAGCLVKMTGTDWHTAGDLTPPRDKTNLKAQFRR